jgi:prolipoprotein diacylglyceryl transferase
VTPATLLGAIPSPPGNTIGLGPLQLRAYGLMIAVGALAGLWIAQRRWAARGGDPGDLAAVATWALPAGLVGARAYHVATDMGRFQGRWWHALAIWEGGLGIPGGIAAGVLAGIWAARGRNLPVPALLDVVAPALPVAQAIGRWGNWFNQELFGRPAEVPWALHVDVEHRPVGMADVATYHPTFLYEGLWNLALAAALIWIGHRWRPQPGQLFAGYVAGYAAGRLWVEALRIDPATELAGLRVNLWVSAATLLAAVTVITIRHRRRPAPAPGHPPVGASR